jgi:hypothetical protein
VRERLRVVPDQPARVDIVAFGEQADLAAYLEDALEDAPGITSTIDESVSSSRVSPRYRWTTRRAGATGLIRQRPCCGPPSSAAKHAGESKRGRHSQSIEPSAPTSAAV